VVEVFVKKLRDRRVRASDFKAYPVLGDTFIRCSLHNILSPLVALLEVEKVALGAAITSDVASNPVVPRRDAQGSDEVEDLC